jgi:5-methylcytosine-specific restriction protein B
MGQRSDGDTESYTLKQVKNMQFKIRSEGGLDFAVNVIEEAEDVEVIKYLLNKKADKFNSDPVDVIHDGKRGIGPVREAILKNTNLSSEIKRDVITRGDDPRELPVAVPESVKKNALAALSVGKPVVLYGPTGTGKTTFAKQLAMEVAVGYDIETATPSWTDQDITGRIAPDYSGDGTNVEYTKEPGCVSKGVLQAEKFREKWAVIIDELTRADISRIFGSLYTAIENRSQTLFETDANEAVTLDPSVKIICTMNVSDRTVNELDNAITRRFAMIKVADYDETQRDRLFNEWIDEHLSSSQLDTDTLVELMDADYRGLNYTTDGSDGEGIQQFGPMHYRDVITFLEKATETNPGNDAAPGVGVYKQNPETAIGEAFKIYILPRLLNDATFSQIKQLSSHYEQLDEKFDNADLTPVIELANQRYQSEQQRLGGR